MNCNDKTMRNLSIELLKFIAVVTVLNSHSELLYGKYSYLATGGAIGDCLFFFASGFTLFLGRSGRFDNWYKRRIRRIYPSLIGLALTISLLSSKSMDLIDLAKGAGNWFITCIMLYYIALYFVRKYFNNKPIIPFLISIITIFIWYYFENRDIFFMYGDTYFKWLHYFLFMLLGAYVGNGTIKMKHAPIKDSFMLTLSIVTFYIFMYLAIKHRLFAEIQILSLIPLIGVVIYIYKLCAIAKVNHFMQTKIGIVIRFISGLCLEIYIVQGAFFTDKFNSLFPLNLIIVFSVIIMAAYFIRSFLVDDKN